MEGKWQFLWALWHASHCKMVRGLIGHAIKAQKRKGAPDDKENVCTSHFLTKYNLNDWIGLVTEALDNKWIHHAVTQKVLMLLRSSLCQMNCLEIYTQWKCICGCVLPQPSHIWQHQRFWHPSEIYGKTQFSFYLQNGRRPKQTIQTWMTHLRWCPKAVCLHSSPE